MTGWPKKLEYPVEEIELVATFVATDTGHVPDEVRRICMVWLLDVSDAAAQTGMFSD